MILSSTTTTETFSIDVPAVPHNALFPNSTVHYLTKSKIKKAMRLCASDAVSPELKRRLDAVLGVGRRVPYELEVEVVWPKGRRKPDLDAALASCKSLLDGIADSIQIDDRYCEAIKIRQRRADPGEAGHVIAQYTLLRS